MALSDLISSESLPRMIKHSDNLQCLDKSMRQPQPKIGNSFLSRNSTEVLATAGYLPSPWDHGSANHRPGLLSRLRVLLRRDRPDLARPQGPARLRVAPRHGEISNGRSPARCCRRLRLLVEVLRHLEVLIEMRLGLGGPGLQVGVLAALTIALE